jgi:hypothetical protein
MNDRERIAARIAVLRAELSDLETADRVLERLNAPHGTTPILAGQKRVTPPAQASELKTIADFAKDILASATPEGMHFTEIADQAMARGYAGRKGSEEKSIRQSFWATMRRDGNTFKMLGEGRFRLT